MCKQYVVCSDITFDRKPVDVPSVVDTAHPFRDLVVSPIIAHLK